MNETEEKDRAELITRKLKDVPFHPGKDLNLEESKRRRWG